MFKVGDIVKLSSIGRSTYLTILYDQTYEVIWVSKNDWVQVRGLRDGLEICYSNQIVEIDYCYIRKQKLKKIRNLVIV